MLKFSSRNPFPLLKPTRKGIKPGRIPCYSYLVDVHLGMQIVKVEGKLRADGCKSIGSDFSQTPQELWIGLAAKRFLTPYTEIRSMLSLIKPKAGSTIVDLGAGYGRMGFVVGKHYPKVKFIGYEYVGERVKESNKSLKRLSHPLVKFKHADLSSLEFKPVIADYYFIYDYGTTDAIQKTLFDLKKIAQEKPITVIARGRDSRDFIRDHHPWLAKRTLPKSYIYFSIYESI